MKKLVALILFVLVGCVPLDVTFDPYAGIPMRTPVVTPTQVASVTPITPPSALPTPKPVPGKSVCTVSTEVPDGYLNLRSGPGIENGILAVLTEGDVVDLVGDRRGVWAEAQINSVRGWINMNYCEEQ